MKILREVCSLPTAPFLEQHVVEYVEGFVRRRPGLQLSRDRHGNLLVTLPGRRKGLARWVFAAHMDHPGLVARRMIGARMLDAEFRGFVVAQLMRGVKVRFYDGGREITGTIVKATPDGKGPRAKSVRVRVDGDVRRGALGMFDLVPAEVRDGTFYSRACDDLAGAAACLEMLDRLRRRPPAATVAVLLTRAEEGGLVGAIAASRRPELLRKSDRIIAIEASAEQPHAPRGAGPIIRVGDRTSLFNSSLTYFLTQQAEALAKKRRGFRYQRALMPGGTCEATVYDVYGFHAAAMCVALGNYHNMDRGKERIAAEYVDVRDWKDMVELFLAVARAGHKYEDGHRALRQRIEKRFERLRPLLR